MPGIPQRTKPLENNAKHMVRPASCAFPDGFTSHGRMTRQSRSKRMPAGRLACFVSARLRVPRVEVQIYKEYRERNGNSRDRGLVLRSRETAGPRSQAR